MDDMKILRCTLILVALVLVPARRPSAQEADDSTVPPALTNAVATSPASTNAAAAIEPAWRVYDDPGMRGDHRWVSEFAQHTKRLDNDEKEKRNENRFASGAMTIRGRYAIPAPDASGRVVRMRLHLEGQRHLRLSFRCGDQQYMVWSDQHHYQYLLAGKVTGLAPFRKDRNKAFHVRRVTDDGGLWYTYADGFLEIRYQDGQFVIARGPMVLLSFPIEEAPRDMVLDMKGSLRLFQVLTLPPLLFEPDPFLAPLDTPSAAGDLAWRMRSHGQDDAARLIRNEAGAVELVSEDTEHPIRADLPFRTKAPAILLMKIDSCTPGAGISVPYLSQEGLSLYVGEANGLRVICTDPSQENSMRTSFDNGLIVDETFYCRAVYGMDFIQIDLSSDGRTWFNYNMTPLRDRSGVSTLSIGMMLAGDRARVAQKTREKAVKARERRAKQTHLQAARRKARRDLERGKTVDMKIFDDPVEEETVSSKGVRQQMRISHVVIRAVPVFDGFVDSEMINGVPSDVTGTAWRLASNHALLNEWAPASVRQEAAVDMVDALVDTADTALVLKAVREAAPFMLPPKRSGSQQSVDCELLLHKLGNRMLIDDNIELSREWLDAWYSLNFSEMKIRRRSEDISPPPVVRTVLYDLYGRKEWEQLRRRALEYMFFSLPGSKNLLGSWMLDQASDNLGVPAGDEGLMRSHFWMHPFRIRTDRETQNMLIDFFSSLKTGENARACKLLVKGYDANALTVMPNDEDLYAPVGVLLKSILDSNKALQQRLVDDFGRVGLIRLNRALEQGRMKDLEQIAIQFHGTDAARKALSSLGDYNLTAGQFQEAVNRYNPLIPEASGQEQSNLIAKRNLALAMMGERATERVIDTVSLPGGDMSAKQYEEMLETLLKKHRSVKEFVDVNPEIAQSKPSRNDLDLHHIADLPFFMTQPINSTVKGQYLLMQQGRVLTAIDMAARKVAWSSGTADPKYERFAYDPLVLADRVVAAVYVDNTRVMRCFNLSDGRVLWDMPFSDHVVSSPFRIGNALFIVTSTTDKYLTLNRIRLSDGQPVFARQLIRHHVREGQIPFADTAASSSSVVIASLGMLVCCNEWGEINWVRRLTFVPPDVDPELSATFPSGNCMIIDGQVIICSPSSPSIDSVDLATGRKVWSRFRPQRRELLGQAGDLVLVRNRFGIEALRVMDGQREWGTRADEEGTSILLGRSGAILDIRLDRVDAKPASENVVRRATLVSTDDGRGLASWDLTQKETTLHDVVYSFHQGEKVFVVTRDYEKHRHRKEPCARLCVLE
jgi:hypothetical protein